MARSSSPTGDYVARSPSPAEGRVTTRELADAIAALTGAVQTLVQSQQQLSERQAALEERIADAALNEKQVMEDLAAQLEPPEAIKARIEQEPAKTFFHMGDEPKMVAINGARWWVMPGENTLPAPVVRQYENGLKDERVARKRREQLVQIFKNGGSDTKLTVDAIIQRKD
jgi:hypothetical protein